MIDDVQQTENQTQSARRELYEVYADKAVKPRYKKKLIESLDEIYGYDLAFLVGLIMRTEFSGNLNVISQSNEISGISFSNGKITRIDLNDKDTFMGELLIKDGFVDRARLLQILQEQGKPLGELLIKNNVATKEQIIGVLVKQMRLRLSKYINNTKYRVNFSEFEITDPGLSISYLEFLNLAHDWVAGRFDGEWLKLHYMELSEGLVEIPQDNFDYGPIKELALSKDLSLFLKNHAESKTFSKIFANIKNDKDQEYFLKCFHYGIMSGQITLKYDPQAEPHSDSVLKNIYNACSKKTGAELLETLAHILKYKPNEIDAIFQAINNYVFAYTGDDQDMKNNMFRIVLEMISKKQYYADEIAKKYASQTNPHKTADLSKKIAEVYRDLLNKNLFVAIDKLKKMNEHSTYTPKLKLYMVWAKALMIHQNNIKINIADLERDFLQILPEDKDSADYYYVKSIMASLKKDENAAKSFYEQSIKMNNELKKYPPFKQTRSFIKNLFKLSLIFFMGFSLKAQAQTDATVPTPEPTPAIQPPSTPAPPVEDNAITPQAKLPFVYLNQYFNYKVMPKDAIQINDIFFNLEDMALNVSDEKIEIHFREAMERFKENPSFMSYSSANQKMAELEYKKSDDKFVIDIKDLDSADFLCLTQKNDYSHLQICKSIKTNPIKGIADILVNNQTVEREGTVILTEKNEKIQFKVTRKNTDFLNLETVHRVVLPAKIEKSANSEELRIQFVDSENARAGWEDTITLSQNYIPLKLDNIITLKQGIYFDNAITKDTVIAETYLDRSKIQQKFYNKFIVEPIFVAEQIAGKSNTADVALNSSLGVGVSLSGDHYLESGRNIFGSVGYYAIKMQPPNANTTTLLSGELSILFLRGGYKFNMNENWSVSGVVRFQEDLFFTQASATSIEASKVFTKALGIMPEYTIYNANKITIGADIGVYLMLPTEVPNSTTAGMGTLLEANLKGSYKVDWGRIVASIAMGNRNQKNDTYAYTGNYLVQRVGLAYLF